MEITFSELEKKGIINEKASDKLITTNESTNISDPSNINEINIDNIPQLQEKQVFYKLSFKKPEQNENDLLSQEFDELVKQIIDTQNETFLQGGINLIEFLITKYSNSEINNIHNLESLSMRINENFGLLNEFGRHLPKLTELKLTGSLIKSISDIGVTFNNLLNLNVSNCSLYNLSGIVCFQNLLNLDCSFNFVSDLIDLEMCYSIQSINLRNNLVEEEDNFLFLSGLTNLVYFNITNNPIQSCNKKVSGLVKKYLSHVESVILEDSHEEFL